MTPPAPVPCSWCLSTPARHGRCEGTVWRAGWTDDAGYHLGQLVDCPCPCRTQEGLW